MAWRAGSTFPWLSRQLDCGRISQRRSRCVYLFPPAVVALESLATEISPLHSLTALTRQGCPGLSRSNRFDNVGWKLYASENGLVEVSAGQVVLLRRRDYSRLRRALDLSASRARCVQLVLHSSLSGISRKTHADRPRRLRSWQQCNHSPKRPYWRYVWGNRWRKGTASRSLCPTSVPSHCALAGPTVAHGRYEAHRNSRSSGLDSHLPGNSGTETQDGGAITSSRAITSNLRLGFGKASCRNGGPAVGTMVRLLSPDRFEA